MEQPPQRAPNKQSKSSAARATRTQALPAYAANSKKMPGRERVTAYNRSAMKPLPSPRMGGKSDTLFAATSPPVRRVLFDDKPKVSMKGDDFTEPLWREGPVTEEEKQARLLEEQEEEALKAGAKADIFEEVEEDEEVEEGDDDLDAVNDLPLHRACEDGDTQRARKCLDEGANVVETDENGCCALFLAAERAHVDCMRLLLQHGAGVDQYVASPAVRKM